MSQQQRAAVAVSAGPAAANSVVIAGHLGADRGERERERPLATDRERQPSQSGGAGAGGANASASSSRLAMDVPPPTAQLSSGGGSASARGGGGSSPNSSQLPANPGGVGANALRSSSLLERARSSSPALPPAPLQEDKCD
jgi:hypothetical protein